ncbi:unnamed protein product, partial [Closterium sp. NIES-64]
MEGGLPFPERSGNHSDPLGGNLPWEEGRGQNLGYQPVPGSQTSQGAVQANPGGPSEAPADQQWGDPEVPPPPSPPPYQPVPFAEPTPAANASARIEDVGVVGSVVGDELPTTCGLTDYVRMSKRCQDCDSPNGGGLPQIVVDPVYCSISSSRPCGEADIKSIYGMCDYIRDSITGQKLSVMPAVEVIYYFDKECNPYARGAVPLPPNTFIPCGTPLYPSIPPPNSTPLRPSIPFWAASNSHPMLALYHKCGAGHILHHDDCQICPAGTYSTAGALVFNKFYQVDPKYFKVLLLPLLPARPLLLPHLLLRHRLCISLGASVKCSMPVPLGTLPLVQRHQRKHTVLCCTAPMREEERLSSSVPSAASAPTECKYKNASGMFPCEPWYADDGALEVGAYDYMNDWNPDVCASDKAYNCHNNVRSTLSLEVDLVRDGHVRFNFTVSAEMGRDGLSFFIDSLSQPAMALESYQFEPRQVVFPLTAGHHTLVWLYSKDARWTKGEDIATLRFIEVDGIGFNDFACTPCEAGFYSAGAAECKACTPEQYAQIIPRTQCLDRPIHLFIPPAILPAAFNCILHSRSAPHFTRTPPSHPTRLCPLSLSSLSACRVDRDATSEIGPCKLTTLTRTKSWKWLEPQICKPSDLDPLPSPIELPCGPSPPPHPLHPLRPRLHSPCSVPSPAPYAYRPLAFTPSPTQLSPSPTQLSPSPTQLSPSPTQLSPSPTQLSPSHTQLSPSPTQLSPSHTQLSPSDHRCLEQHL